MPLLNKIITVRIGLFLFYLDFSVWVVVSYMGIIISLLIGKDYFTPEDERAASQLGVVLLSSHAL